MKQTRLWVLLVLTTVAAVAAVAAGVTPPTDLSLRGIVEWVGVGGHIASGTTNPAYTQPVGTRFTNLSDPSRPIDYRHTGSAWRALWTWNHRLLSNLDYVTSGHGIVPVAAGGTGATNTTDALRYLGAEPASTCIRADGSDPDAAWIDFVATDTKPAFAAGRLFWDTDDECLSFYGAATDTINQVGQEMWIHVKNPGVATLTNGSVVYMTHPDTGKEPYAYLAQADASDTSRVIGVCTHDIPPDSTGIATIFGLVRDVNTDGMTPGEKVYLSATVPGSFSMTVPPAPATSMLVGYVMKAHATAGVIYVRLQLNGALTRATFWDDVYMADTVTFATAPVFSTPLQTREALGFPSSVGKANYVLAVGTDTTTLYWSPVGGGGGGGVSDHSLLTNLDYALSGHTGFAASTDLPNNASFTLAGLGEKSYWSLTDLPSFGTMASETATNYVATDTFTGHTDATAAHGVGEIAGIDDIPLNASFSFDLLSDSPDYTGNGGKVLALNAEGTALQWTAVAGVGSMSHATLSDLDYAGSGHTGFAASSDLAAYQPIASMSDYALDTDIPNNASFTLTGLSEKSYWSLTDLPTFGTMASETATDYLKVADLPPIPNNASFSFAGLSDVPTYTAQAGKVLAVNSTEDGIEWIEAGSGSGTTTLASLTDVPAFSGNENRVLSIASDGSTLFWAGVAEIDPYATCSYTVLPQTTRDAYASWSSDLVATYIVNRSVLAPIDDGYFHGSVMMPDDRVLLVPNNGANIYTYDPHLGTLQAGPAHGQGGLAFHGAVVGPNGKVYLLPRRADYIGIYDIALRTYTNSVAVESSDECFFGGVIAPNGKIILVPGSLGCIGVYDILTNTYSRGPSIGATNYEFLGAVLMPDGNVCLVPHNYDYVGLYNVASNTFSNGPSHGEGDLAFWGGVCAPNGKIILIPRRSSYIGIYDPVANTYTRGPAHGRGDHAFCGGCIGADGMVVLSPLNSDYIGIYDPVANTYTNGPLLSSSVDSLCSGATLMPDGDIFLCPMNFDYASIFEGAAGPVDLNTCLSPFLNKF